MKVILRLGMLVSSGSGEEEEGITLRLALGGRDGRAGMWEWRRSVFGVVVLTVLYASISNLAAIGTLSSSPHSQFLVVVDSKSFFEFVMHLQNLPPA